MTTSPDQVSGPARATIPTVSGTTAGWSASPAAPVAARLAFVAVAASVAMLPLLRPAGPGNSAPDDVMIVLAVVLTGLALITTSATVRLPYSVPVAVLVVAGALGAMVNEPTSAAVLALGQDLLLFAFAAAIANVARTTRTLGALLRVWAISAIVWATLLVGAVLAGDTAVAGVTARTGTRASLLFGDANLAANYFVISFLVIAMARTPRRRAARFVAYALLIAAVAMTGSLGGLLTLALAIASLTVVAIVRRFGVVTAVAMVLLVGPLLFVAVRGGYDALTAAARDTGSVLHDSFGRTTASVESRDLILGEDLDLYARAAMVGNGPTSTKGALARDQSVYVKEAHNDYLATGVERGALGLLGLAGLFAVVAVRSRRALQRARVAAVAQVVPNAAGLVIAALVIACSGMFYEVLHFRQVWALLGVLAATGLVRDAGADAW